MSRVLNSRTSPSDNFFFDLISSQIYEYGLKFSELSCAAKLLNSHKQSIDFVKFIGGRLWVFQLYVILL